MSDQANTPTAFCYVRSMHSAKLYAVQMRDGWIPDRAVEVQPGQLASEPEAHDFGDGAIDASTWNSADLVRICPSGRRQIIEGRQIHTRRAASSGRRAMPNLAIGSAQSFEELREAATAATIVREP